ncbi:MAG TPA: hypothetical protein VFJ68_13550 [Casimicrobiaceae bacterium]|nr:hypothetical protein [Casimicrobiaceae bacterium]
MQLAWIFRAFRIGVLFIAALVLPLPAFGSAFSTNNSDIYNATNESGWAIELVQHADVIFATIYTYDSNMNPIFYSATLFAGGTGPSGNAIWTGDLIVSSGPWFGGAFDESKVVRRKVGAINYVPQDTTGGTVSFTVDGVVVTKQIARVTLRNDSYAGIYQGTYKLVSSGCSDPTNNGTILINAVFTVTQGTNALTVVTSEVSGDSCTLTGDYVQFGQFGDSLGQFTCASGIKGTNQLFEMNVTPTDFRGRIIQNDNLGCSVTGSFAGIRQ